VNVDYSREHVMALDPTTLKAMITERAHHTVEIPLYEALATGGALGPTTGNRVRELLAVWAARALPAESGELAWVRRLLQLAEEVQRGRPVDLAEFAGTPRMPATGRWSSGCSSSGGQCATGRRTRCPTG
jgi:hypothetical protein